MDVHERLKVEIPESDYARLGTLDQVVKLTLFLTDLSQFAKVNAIMTEVVGKP